MNPHIAILEKARQLGALRTHEWQPARIAPKPQEAMAWRQVRDYLLREKSETFTQGGIAKELGAHSSVAKKAIGTLLADGLIRDIGKPELLTGNRLAPVWGWVDMPEKD